MIQLNSEFEAEGAKIILSNFAREMGVEAFGIRITEDFAIETNIPEEVIAAAQAHPKWAMNKVSGGFQGVQELMDWANEEFRNSQNPEGLDNEFIFRLLAHISSVIGKETHLEIVNSLP